jgi:hypothetical protein
MFARIGTQMTCWIWKCSFTAQVQVRAGQRAQSPLLPGSLHMLIFWCWRNDQVYERRRYFGSRSFFLD